MLIRTITGAIIAILIYLTACFVTDIAALLVGKAFGSHKLCPKISPKKTVEGAFGGVICTVLVAAIAAVLLDKYEIK